MAYKVLFDRELCVGCGACVKDCPAHFIDLDTEKKAGLITDFPCIYCGHCVAVCPMKAVSIDGYEDEPIEMPKDIKGLDPADLLNAIRFRRTIRQYKDKGVPDDVINDIIEVGRMTPTARNKQDVKYYILKDNIKEFEERGTVIFKELQNEWKVTRPELARYVITKNFFFMGAPLAIVITCDEEIDGILAGANMMLMAEAHGLGGFFCGLYKDVLLESKEVRDSFGIGDDERIGTVLVLGYPNVKYKRAPQRNKAVVKRL